MDAKSLRKLGPELKAFLARFADCFEYQAEGYLATYVRGQLSDLARKSVEPMALQAAVPPRSLQEFLTHLQWDEQGVRDRVQKIVATEHMAGVTIGLVDETSFVKKGTKTPGVQRQWCGHLGKIENCVVTVHLGVACGDFHAMLDGDLFLPESWDADRDRCRRAGIPDEVVYRPKWKIALEQYDRAVKSGLRFDWMTFDEGYGGKPEYLRELTARQQKWVAEVPKNVFGWLTRPRVTSRPQRGKHRGRPAKTPRRVEGEPTAKRLDVLLKRHPKLRDQPWRLYRLDDRDQGPSVWEVKQVTLHPQVEHGLPGDPLHLLVARHVLTKGDVKYFLSNAPADTPVETLLWVALSRHRVERLFQDQKTELGLDHYEGRKYGGLIRHLMVTLVSYLFLMRATLARRGEKSGVDTAPNPPGRLAHSLHQVA